LEIDTYFAYIIQNTISKENTISKWC
jgi:hypothetical protein